MKFNFAKKKLTNFEYQRNMLLGLTAVLLVLQLIMAMSLFCKNERIIVLPPEVKREFWVEGNRFSDEYLEEMAVYFMHLSFDVNQTTLPYQTRILLRYAEAETGNYLRSKYERDLKKLKKNNASTRFESNEVTVYPDKNLAYVTGYFNKYVGGKLIQNSRETYAVKFHTYRGRLFFKCIQKQEGKTDDED